MSDDRILLAVDEREYRITIDVPEPDGQNPQRWREDLMDALVDTADLFAPGRVSASGEPTPTCQEPPESWSDPNPVPYLGWRWLFRRTKRGRK